ncbi:hypothetical protein [Burkholderia sp. TSV86]|uniref:hypothetical protein n=1 Tax=Burkholderia sp. TSV86 TaxID=1385594 RepID=UPI0012E3EE38|nr:hypothetical protein [Burkholderia sp. TSV86]
MNSPEKTARRGGKRAPPRREKKRIQGAMISANGSILKPGAVKRRRRSPTTPLPSWQFFAHDKSGPALENSLQLKDGYPAINFPSK